MIFQHDVAFTNPRIDNRISGMTMLRNIERPTFVDLFRVPSPPKKKTSKSGISTQLKRHNAISIPFPESPTSKYPLRVCCRWIGQKSHRSFGREKVTSPMNESERSEFFFDDSARFPRMRILIQTGKFGWENV